jgi:hypothetical protein
MKHQSKFSTNQQQEQAAESLTAKKAGQEFESVEQLIRHDAGQTLPPPSIARRLRESIGETRAPRRAWWRRLVN